MGKFANKETKTFYYEESSQQKNDFRKCSSRNRLEINGKIHNSESMRETLKFGNCNDNKTAADKDTTKINNKSFDIFNYKSADIKKHGKLKHQHFNYEQNGRAYFV